MRIYNMKPPLTEEMVRQINEMARKEDLCLTYQNTKKLDAKLIQTLNSNVEIRILGGLDSDAKTKFAGDGYVARTTYTPKELGAILPIFERIERNINPL